MKKIPYTTLLAFAMQSWNPAAGPVIVTFWMFIVCPGPALVTIPPSNASVAGRDKSEAEMMWFAPSTVVMLDGTVRGDVTSPQSAVNVNVVVPLVVPAQTVVISPPGMGAAAAAGANATSSTTTINDPASSPTTAPHARATRGLRREAPWGTSRVRDDCGLGRIVATAHPHSTRFMRRSM